MADIERDNPYEDQPSAPVTWGVGPSAPVSTSTMQNPTVAPRLADPTAGMTAPVVPATSPAPTTPLNQQQYANAQIQGIEARKDITQKQGENLAQGHEAERDVYAAGQAEQSKSIEDSRRAMQQAIADANARDLALRAEIHKASQEKIDPEHWWNSKSTGGKVLAGIGMILGGVGGGLQRTGRNPAIEQMNRAIDEDINAQKSHIENNWKAIAEKHGLDNDIYNRELHRQVWENNFRTAALEKVKLQLAQAGAQTQSVSARNNAAMGIQDLNDQQLAIRNKQYLLGQQSLLAQQARIRKLSDEADKDVQELVKEKGVDFDTAMKAVYSRPKFRELQGGAAASLGVQGPALVDPQLKKEYQTEIAKQVAQANLLGIKPGDPKYNQIMDVVNKDPKFAPLLRPSPIGTVVPETQKSQGAETEEQLRNRTVNVVVPLTDATGRPVIKNGVTQTQTVQRQAVNKEAADKFMTYQEAAPAVDQLYKQLKDAADKGEGDKYDAARAQLIEILPKYYGFNRGPSVAQVKDTFGDAIPGYFTYQLTSKERTVNKLDILKNTLDQQKQAMEQQTFSTSTQSPAAPTPAIPSYAKPAK